MASDADDTLSNCWAIVVLLVVCAPAAESLLGDNGCGYGIGRRRHLVELLGNRRAAGGLRSGSRKDAAAYRLRYLVKNWIAHVLNERAGVRDEENHDGGAGAGADEPLHRHVAGVGKRELPHHKHDQQRLEDGHHELQLGADHRVHRRLELLDAAGCDGLVGNPDDVSAADAVHGRGRFAVSMLSPCCAAAHTSGM